MKPIRDKLTKKALAEQLALYIDGENPERAARQAIDGLAEIIQRCVVRGGVGEFSLPGVLKVSLRDRPAVKKGTMVRNPGTGDMMPSPGRPASKVVKIKPLAKLKEAVG